MNTKQCSNCDKDMPDGELRHVSDEADMTLCDLCWRAVQKLKEAGKL